MWEADLEENGPGRSNDKGVREALGGAAQTLQRGGGEVGGCNFGLDKAVLRRAMSYLSRAL